MSRCHALPNRRNHITQKVWIARLMSLALQYGAPLEKVDDLLAGLKFARFSPVSGHDRIKHSSSLIVRYLLEEYCGRHELGYMPMTAQSAGATVR